MLSGPINYGPPIKMRIFTWANYETIPGANMTPDDFRTAITASLPPAAERGCGSGCSDHTAMKTWWSIPEACVREGSGHCWTPMNGIGAEP